jgi:DNA-binding GntR family transcriptional regulator
MGLAVEIISRNPNLSEQVYSYLKDRIIRGDYPPGKHVSEIELAQELKVSRTPVSIALTILTERGLLEHEAGKLSVPKLTLKDVIDLYCCRLAFDALATRLAATLISKKDLNQLAKHLKVWEKPAKEDDLYALWVADLSFHETIYKVSNNRHLIRFAQIAAEQAAVYRRNTIRRLSQENKQRSKEDVRLEHQHIFEALAAHDPDAAEVAAKTHIQNVIDHLNTMEVIDLGFTNNEQGL